ncbi:hypothetical protein FF38_08249 [Lucilia cuprina]|uniref:Uncharacterized protein n=1 Tax=Lucilia cuprina TaxID=7375 RepID=A0A0L0BYT9_LUCCU|nr:hypothetical protein FF38_08249 [Lucilia cuprina]
MTSDLITSNLYSFRFAAESKDKFDYKVPAGLDTSTHEMKSHLAGECGKCGAVFGEFFKIISCFGFHTFSGLNLKLDFGAELEILLVSVVVSGTCSSLRFGSRNSCEGSCISSVFRLIYVFCVMLLLLSVFVADLKVVVKGNGVVDVAVTKFFKEASSLSAISSLSATSCVSTLVFSVFRFIFGFVVKFLLLLLMVAAVVAEIVVVGKEVVLSIDFKVVVVIEESCEVAVMGKMVTLAVDGVLVVVVVDDIVLAVIAESIKPCTVQRLLIEFECWCLILTHLIFTQNPSLATTLPQQQ